MRTGSDALLWARTQEHSPAQNWQGQCLKFVRSCYQIKARDHDASQAWKRALYKHPGDTHPPPGVPIFWKGGRWGHTAISIGSGWCYSTDIKRKGQVDACRISLIGEDWDYKYLGWSEDLNGVRIYTPTRRIRSEWYVYDQKKKKVVAYGPADGAAYSLGYRQIEESR